MKIYVDAAVSHEDINDMDILRAHCDWVVEKSKELKALFGYKSQSMIRSNNIRALSAIDTMRDSLNELELYIQEVCEV